MPTHAASDMDNVIHPCYKVQFIYSADFLCSYEHNSSLMMVLNRYNNSRNDCFERVLECVKVIGFCRAHPRWPPSILCCVTPRQWKQRLLVLTAVITCLTKATTQQMNMEYRNEGRRTGVITLD